ncbi:MAG: amidase [Sneathiellales bacterium]|nr:amidase [Sneathiellales bacterium]
MQGYENLDATGLSDLVKKGEVSALELLEQAITRTEQLNPQLNAIVQTFYDDAKNRLQQGEAQKGPFAGVPFLVKDLISTVEGTATTGSCKILEHCIEPADSELVRRMRKAGLVIFGKTNTPEFGIMGITEPQFRGAARNPWDLSLTPGGSSGGAGAAVAARIVPMAHGGDGGGSIRIPSSHCGLVGLLPSRGRNPIGPDIGEAWGGFAREHVLTRSVRDSAKMLDCLSGPDIGALYTAPSVGYGFYDACEEPARQLRIAYTKDALYGADNHPDCIKAVEQTVSLLQELGHEVVEARPEFDRHTLAKAYFQIVSAWVAWEIEYSARKAERPLRSGDYELTSWVMGLVGWKNSAALLADAMDTCHQASRLMGEFHQKYDLLLTSTTARPPAEIGELYPSGKDEFAMKILKALPFKGLLNKALDSLAEEALSATPNTQLFNQTGQPALSLPLFENAAGLPIGIQFAAEFGNEWTLYNIAAQLEKARPWRDRKPSILAEG